MANPELKNTASDNLNSTKSSMSSNLSSVGSTVRDTIKDNKNVSELKDRVMDQAGPMVRETIDQVSDVASNLYNKANTWLSTGNNRNYSFIALAAAAGIAGFFIGRGFRNNSMIES
jgi:hypothetical protein